MQAHGIKLAIQHSRTLYTSGQGLSLRDANNDFRRRLCEAHPETDEAMQKQRLACGKARPVSQRSPLPRASDAGGGAHCQMGNCHLISSLLQEHRSPRWPETIGETTAKLHVLLRAFHCAI